MCDDNTSTDNVVKPHTEYQQESSSETTPMCSPKDKVVPASEPTSSAAAEGKSTATSEMTMETRKRGVSFDRIEIREYSRCLGNNPAVTHGPPLSIDWSYNVVGTFEVDKYEQSRPARRIGYQMMVPGAVREQILLEQTNVTRKQIVNTVAQIQSDRHKRQMCVAMQEFEHWHVVLETMKRRYRRFRKGVSKDKEQQLLWEEAQRVSEEKRKGKQLEIDESSSTSTESSSSGQISSHDMRIAVAAA